MSSESPDASPRPMLSPETLQDGPWFESVRRTYEVRTRTSHPPRWLVPAIGYSIATVFWLVGWNTTSIVAASIITALTLLDLASPATARRIQKGLAVFGGWVGHALGWVLLAPLFLIVGPLSRVFTRVMGKDPLGRRMADAPSYWHFGAPESRRTPRTARMFCVEASAGGGKNWLGALALLGFVGLIVAEIVLRISFGFHNPVLYQNDVDCGYRVRPGQHFVKGGGEVHINNFSMRYPRDVSPEKPAGVFRILLIGDSTLYAGEDMKDGETYAGRVETILHQTYPGRTFEVLPVGVNGWGPHHTLGYIRRYGTFGADLAIIAMSAGNADRPFSSVESTRFPVKKPVLALQTVAAKLCWDGLRFTASGGSYDFDQSTEQTNRRLESGENAFVETARAILKTTPECMAEAVPQICYGMNALEGTFELVPNQCALRSFQKIEPRLRELGVPMRYPKDLFKNKGTVTELWRSEKDTAHLGLKGHRIFADYLVSRITEASRGFRKYAGLPESPAATAALQ